MAQRQTLSYLQGRFEQAGLRPQTKFGQNFLIDLNLVNLIASSASLGPRDVVLEVGTGLGSLTSVVSKDAGHVITVEIDQHLAEIAKSEFDDAQNVTLLLQDALKSKNTLDPGLVTTLRERVGEISGGRLKLVANLPYNVATPIISNLLDIEPWPQLMVATIQKELAQRITARPGTKDYSALSVWIQAQCKCEIVRILPPSVFWPRPKVDSAILRIKPQKVLRNRIQNRPFFHQFARNIFVHRRKFLRSALQHAMQQAAVDAAGKTRRAEKVEKTIVDEILGNLGVPASSRAESLSPSQMIDLADLVGNWITSCEAS